MTCSECLHLLLNDVFRKQKTVQFLSSNCCYTLCENCIKTFIVDAGMIGLTATVTTKTSSNILCQVTLDNKVFVDARVILGDKNRLKYLATLLLRYFARSGTRKEIHRTLQSCDLLRHTLKVAFSTSAKTSLPVTTTNVQVNVANALINSYNRVSKTKLSLIKWYNSFADNRFIQFHFVNDRRIKNSLAFLALHDDAVKSIAYSYKKYKQEQVL